jgi:O-antigen/teichoic acid export membrane protein
MALMQLVWQIIEWGLPTYGTRELASSLDPVSRASVIAKHTQAKVLLALMVLPLAIAVASRVPVISEEPKMLALALVLAMLGALNLSWFFQGTGSHRLPVTIELLGLLVGTPIIIFGLPHFPFTWFPLLVLVIIGLSAVIFSHAIALRGSRLRLQKWREVLGCIRESSFLFVQRSASTISSPATVFCVGVTASSGVAAPYAVAERLAAIALGFLQPVSQVFFGRVNDKVHQARLKNDEGEQWKAIRLALLVSVLAGGAVLVPLAILSDTAVSFVLGVHDHDLASSLRLLCAAVFWIILFRSLSTYVLIPLRHDRLAALLGLSAVLSAVSFTAYGALQGVHEAAVGRFAAALFVLVLGFVVIIRMGLHRKLMAGALRANDS